MSHSIFIPRWMDADNLNAQNKNAQLLLRHWPASDWHITTLAYNAPNKMVSARKDIEIVRLWRRHGWMPNLFLRYLRQYDLVFYPGVHAADAAGLWWRRRLGFRAPVVATLEGLLGDEAREKEYSEWAGHPVYCQHVAPEVLRRVDEMLQAADHIIAISPFLAEMGKRRYGDKFSVLPLGIDTTLFYPAKDKKGGRLKVVSAGRVESHKRPEVFLELAAKRPDADFIWYGEGSLRGPLAANANARGLKNIEFPGNQAPGLLADRFRDADIFVFPSLSEGVPKVTQEAAACGLPVVLFGFYEAPSVTDGENGYVVWNDGELFARLSALIENHGLRTRMGDNGARLARDCGWDVLAPKWEASLKTVLPDLIAKLKFPR
jgi:glycosyltransferase involved in cell wall biosynthesis